jgi:hypothetical protein
MATARSSGSFNGRFMEGLLPKVDSTGSGQEETVEKSAESSHCSRLDACYRPSLRGAVSALRSD